MLTSILMLLFLILLVILGFRYDEIVPPYHQLLKDIDNFIFDRGKKQSNQKIETYKIGLFPKITLMCALLFICHSLYTGDYGLKGGPISFGIAFVFSLYSLFFGIYKIEVIDVKLIKFISILRSSSFNLSEIVEVKESIFSFTIKFQNESVSFNNYSDEYRKFANRYKPLKK